MVVLKTKTKIISFNQCCGAGQSRGFLAGAEAGADLKFELEPEPIFLGRLRLLFLASEKRNYLKMFFFHCILYIFLYNSVNSTCDSTYSYISTV